MDWKYDATYRFISNPENKPSIRIFTRVMMLLLVVLFLGILGLIVYLAITAGSSGWIVLLIFLVPILTAAIITPIAFDFAQKQLNKSQTKDK